MTTPDNSIPADLLQVVEQGVRRLGPLVGENSLLCLDGDEWLINGEKYYISGAGDPRCKIMIVMVQTSPDGPAHRRSEDRGEDDEMSEQTAEKTGFTAEERR